MKDDKAITRKDIDEASVVLKPVLGVKPRAYVPAALAAAALLALFLLLLYPGLRRPGAYYRFSVDPPGAAVIVDGAYAGHAPCEVFLSSGRRVVRLERPGFAPLEAELAVRGRVFATLIAKPRVDYAATLAPADAAAALRSAVADFAAWNLVGTPSESYQLPMVLSDASRAVTLAPGSYDPSGLASAAVSYVSSAPALRDAARASALAYSGSAAPTPATLGRLVSSLARELARDPAALAVLAPYLGAADRARLEASPSYRTLAGALASAGRGDRPSVAPAGAIAGVSLVRIGPGLAVIGAGGALPAAVPVEAFSLAVRETTVGQWRRFVSDRPEWGPEATASLVAKGLATDDYLKDFSAANDGDALRYVSRPAAEAYCAWLSARAPSGYRFALPTEAQWTLASQASGASAKTGAVLADGGVLAGSGVLTGSGVPAPRSPEALGLDAAGLAGLLGNLWEWCADPYAVSPAAGRDARRGFPSGEGVVRGGSWANRPELVGLASRGPARLSDCTAYVGFRVALVSASE